MASNKAGKVHLEITIAEHLEVKPFWTDLNVMERIARIFKNKKEKKNGSNNNR